MMFRVGDDRPFENTFRIFTKMYVCPRKSDIGHMKLFYLKGFILRFILFLTCCVGSALHLWKITKEKVKEISISEDLVVIFGGVGMIMVVEISSRLHRRWIKLINSLLEFGKYGKPQDFSQTVKKNNKKVIFFVLYYVLGVTAYSIESILNTASCKRLNKEKQLGLICEAFTGLWLPVNIQSNTIQRLIFLIQFIAIISVVVPCPTSVFFTWELIEVFACHVRHFKIGLKKCFEIENMEERRATFRKLVQYHIHIIEMYYEVSDIAKEMFGYISLISALILACSELSMIRSEWLGCVFFVGWISSLFVVCLVGQKTTDDNLSVCDAIWESNWYMVDKGIKKDLLIIMLRSQKPIHVRAMPFGIMNYALYVLVLRTSYSYLAILEQTS